MPGLIAAEPAVLSLHLFFSTSQDKLAIVEAGIRLLRLRSDRQLQSTNSLYITRSHREPLLVETFLHTSIPLSNHPSISANTLWATTTCISSWCFVAASHTPDHHTPSHIPDHRQHVAQHCKWPLSVPFRRRLVQVLPPLRIASQPMQQHPRPRPNPALCLHLAREPAITPRFWTLAVTAQPSSSMPWVLWSLTRMAPWHGFPTGTKWPISKNKMRLELLERGTKSDSQH